MTQPVLLLDDGELDDVQRILEELKIAFARVRGGAIVPGQPGPSRLLVATPRRVDAVDASDDFSEEGPAVRVVVVEEDSPSLREKLREVGFDYLVRRPVHHEALRLLLMHCVYTGEERRREPRLPIGAEISIKPGLFSRTATLVDLSLRGCRLLTKFALEPGKRLRVQIPPEVGAAEPLSLRGRVGRMLFDERLGDEGLYASAVVFENVATETRQELEWILEERAQGPAVLTERGAETDDPAEGYSGAGVGRRERVFGSQARAAERRPERRAVPKPAESESADGEVPHRPLPPRAADPPVAPVPDEVPSAASPAEAESSPEPGAETFDEQEFEAAERGSEAAGASGDPAGSPADERRRDPRGAFDAKVPAFGGRAMRMLVGRDISRGGMRVESTSEVELGDRLHLAIYGAAREEPFLVWATVQRDDGEDGVAVVFDEVHPKVADKLDKLIAMLPSIESLHDEESEAMGTVVTEILESR